MMLDGFANFYVNDCRTSTTDRLPYPLTDMLS